MFLKIVNYLKKKMTYTNLISAVGYNWGEGKNLNLKLFQIINELINT